LSAGAGVAAAGAVSTKAFASPEEDPGLCGRVVEVSPRDMTIEVVETGESLSVVAARDLVVLRDGRTELSAFTVGEKVVVHGSRRAFGRFLATAVDVVYDLIESASVLERDGRILATSEGEVAMDGLTEPRDLGGGDKRVTAEPLPSIGAGDTVNVLARWDPSSGRLLARSIGVRAEA